MMKILACIASTSAGKWLVGLWAAALLGIIFFPTLGFFYGEFLGYLAFAVLPVSILINISILIAFHVENGSVLIAKAAWIGMSVFVLFITLTLLTFSIGDDADIWEFLAWGMLFISFPFGLLISFLDMEWTLGLSKITEVSSFPFVTNWLVYFALGYLQWFILLPWAWRKWRTRREI